MFFTLSSAIIPIFIFIIISISIENIIADDKVANEEGILPPPLSVPPQDENLRGKHDKEWLKEAIKILWDHRIEVMGQTPIRRFEEIPNVLLIFKDESKSPTESLKHRYSWALVMWALLSGHIRRGTKVYEASSGNTARSEAYICRLIGVDYIAVLPDTTEEMKVKNIEAEKGRVVKIPPAGANNDQPVQIRVPGTKRDHIEIVPGNSLDAAEKLAEKDPNGFFINQFGNSELALDYHQSGNSDFPSVNMFDELLKQMEEYDQKHNVQTLRPTHFVFSAATGGSISSVSRYVTKHMIDTEIVVADTEYSAYFDMLLSDRFKGGLENPLPFWTGPGMAGTGFGWAGPIIKGKTSSLITNLIDRALKIPDLASVACMQILRYHYKIFGGPSTGVNFAGALQLIATDSEAYSKKYKERMEKATTDKATKNNRRYSDKANTSTNTAGGEGREWFKKSLESAAHQAKTAFVECGGTLINTLLCNGRKKQRVSSTSNHHLVISTLIADNGANYESTYYNFKWISDKFAPHGGLIGLSCWYESLLRFINDVSTRHAKRAVLPFATDNPIALGVKLCDPEQLKKNSQNSHFTEQQMLEKFENIRKGNHH